MSICKVYLNNSVSSLSFYQSNESSSVKQLVGNLREENAYSYMGLFNTDLTGTDAAEEIFDLSNNPNREDERFERWGQTNRSLSVGDLVQIDDECYVCCPIGWVKV